MLHVRSFSKSHGPDLRIAALGGPAALVDPIVARRMLGPGWTSRMLQTILYDLLTSRESIDEISEARRIYFARQKALTDALRRHGVDLAQADGINAWLPVNDERDAIVQLAASGIRVAGGSPFFATDSALSFIRVTTGALPDEIESIAEALAATARGSAEAGQAPGVHSLKARWA